MSNTPDRLNIRMQLTQTEYDDLKARNTDFRPFIKEVSFICEMVDRAFHHPETLGRGLGLMIDTKRDLSQMVARDFRVPEKTAGQLRKMKEVSGLALHHLLPMIVLDTVYMYSDEQLAQFRMRPIAEEDQDYLTWFANIGARAEAKATTIAEEPREELPSGEYADAETVARIAREETEFWERYNTEKDHNGLTAADRELLTPEELAQLPPKPVEVPPEDIRHYSEPNPFGNDTYNVNKFSSKTLTLEQRRQHARDHGYTLPEDEQPNNNVTLPEGVI